MRQEIAIEFKRSKNAKTSLFLNIPSHQYGNLTKAATYNESSKVNMMRMCLFDFSIKA